MRWTGPEFALLTLVLACAPTHAGVTPLTAAPTTADQLTEMATAALAADGRLEPAETLYAAGAEVLAEGRRRIAVPRFAGVEAGGEVVVGSIRVDLAGSAAWASVEYRWLAQGQNLIREGRATLVLVQANSDGRWRIVHAHSSLAP
jgi:hypothetical protein